jgi:prepilin-type N-terminal cleavage/methylation domain-containing protein
MRERGYTLAELLVVIVVGSSVLLTATGLIASVRSTERASAAYVRDLVSLQRAVERLEVDLREAKGLEDLDWRLDGDRLCRGDERVADGVATFTLSREGSIAHVRIVLAARAAHAARKDAAVTISVRMRNAEGGDRAR